MFQKYILYQIFKIRYKLLGVKLWHSYEPLCCFSANIWTLSQRCLLIDTMLRHGTASNQRRNYVVYFNVAIYNVESTLFISMLIWKTWDNVEATLSFATLSVTTSKPRCENDHFWKEWKNISKRKYGAQSFNHYFNDHL